MMVAEISQSKNMFEYNQPSLALEYVESELDVLLENIVCVGTAS